MATIEEILRQQGANILGSGPVLRDGLSPVPLPTLEAPTFGVVAPADNRVSRGTSANIVGTAAQARTSNKPVRVRTVLPGVGGARGGGSEVINPLPNLSTLQSDAGPKRNLANSYPAAGFGLSAPAMVTPAIDVPAPAFDVAPATDAYAGKNDPVKPGDPYDLPERKTSFAFNDGGGYVNPNVSTASIPVPASLAAPQFGSVRPADTGGPTLISISDPATDPTNPQSRNFDPRAAKLAMQQNALDVERANALTAADADLARTDLSGQYGLQERALANQGALANTQLGGQFGLQERGLANEGQLANTALAGEYALERSRVDADAAVSAAMYKIQAEGNTPANLKALQEAKLLAQQVAANEAQIKAGASPATIIAGARKGQPTPGRVVADSLGNPIATLGVGGLENADDLQALQALLAQIRSAQ